MIWRCSELRLGYAVSFHATTARKEGETVLKIEGQGNPDLGSYHSWLGCCTYPRICELPAVRNIEYLCRITGLVREAFVSWMSVTGEWNLIHNSALRIELVPGTGGR